MTAIPLVPSVISSFDDMTNINLKVSLRLRELITGEDLLSINRDTFQCHKN